MKHLFSISISRRRSDAIIANFFSHNAKSFELLLSKNHIANFLAPLVVRIDKKDEMSFGLGRDLMTIQDCQLRAKDGILENVANPFNGILISKKLVQKIVNEYHS